MELKFTPTSPPMTCPPETLPLALLVLMVPKLTPTSPPARAYPETVPLARLSLMSPSFLPTSPPRSLWPETDPLAWLLLMVPSLFPTSPPQFVWGFDGVVDTMLVIATVELLAEMVPPLFNPTSPPQLISSAWLSPPMTMPAVLLAEMVPPLFDPTNPPTFRRAFTLILRSRTFRISAFAPTSPNRPTRTAVGRSIYRLEMEYLSPLPSKVAVNGAAGPPTYSPMGLQPSPLFQ